MNLRNFLSVLALAGTVAACGGGSNPTEAPAADDLAMPASATASVAAFNAFVAQVPSDDAREPLTLGAVLPPTSDDEPASVVR